MGWYLKEENLIIEERFETRIQTQLYLMGINNVPEVLLNDKPFGELHGWNYLYVNRDRYYEIASFMRKQIENSFEFRIHIKKKTLELLSEFEKQTKELEKQVKKEKVNSDWLLNSLLFYGKMLSLLEFNGMISYTWFKNKLNEISNNTFSIEDFSYTKIYPHRIYLYKHKLQFLQQWYYLNESDMFLKIDDFMDKYNYLSDEGNPLIWDFTQKKNELFEELVNMKSKMSIKEIESEIKLIENKRRQAEQNYKSKLYEVYNAMNEKKYSTKEISNFIHALTMISFTFTEEEQRHYLQDKYWVLLNKLMRRLEVSASFITIEGLIAAVRQNDG